MPLTDVAIRNARRGPKVQRLWDEKGLYLEISPAKGNDANPAVKSKKALAMEGKWWRLKYRFNRVEKRLALGSYSTMSLQEARIARDDSRKLLHNGIDPGAEKRKEKSARADRAANSFEQITREWYVKQFTVWTPAHASRVIRRFERDIFPWIGSRPVSEISAPELLAVLRRIESRGVHETTRRALGDCGMVFSYAIASGRATMAPSSALRGALCPVESGHFAAQTEPGEVAKILRKLDEYSGTPAVRAALRLQPMLFCRPGELRKAEWKDIDLDTGEWRYLVTKTKTEHIVPLSRQAQAILRDLQPVTGRGRFVFPCARKGTPERPMSDVGVLKAMRTLGIGQDEQTGHGWRATARTLLDEELKFLPHLIEHQLAHAVRDPNGRAYNRTSFLPERRAMMQKWADYLDSLKNGSDQRVIVGNFKTA